MQYWGDGKANRLTGMDNVHGSHGAAGVVEYPLLIGVDVAADGHVGLELVDDVLDHGLGVAGVGVDGGLGDGIELGEVEDVELVDVLVEDVEDGSQDGEEDGEPLEEGGETAAAALVAASTGGGLLRRGRGFGCHCDVWRYKGKEERAGGEREKGRKRGIEPTNCIGNSKARVVARLAHHFPFTVALAQSGR